MRTARRRHGSRSLLALAWLCAGVTACLSRGDPPAGRQVIADRTSVLAGVVTAAPDGIMRLLIARPHADPTAADLFVVADGGGGSAPTERLLMANVTWGYGCNIGYCFTTDAQGRLFVSHDYDAIQSVSQHTRVDAVTGDRLELGRGFYGSIQISESGGRLLAPTTPAPTLFEADDQSTILTGASSALFIGDDLFYVRDESLVRWPPGGTPLVVHVGVRGILPQDTLGGPVLLLLMVNDDPAVFTYTVLDPVTLQEIFPPVAARQAISVSPDRRWLLDYSNVPWSFTDGTTGAVEEFAPPDSLNGLFEWRPAHSEIWIQTFDQSMPGPPSTWIKKPGAPPAVDPIFLRSLSEGISNSSLFTHDGSYVFSVRLSRHAGSTTQVGSADDLNAPRIDVGPENSATYNYWRLADGRIVTASFYSDPQRSEIRAIDPANGRFVTLATEAMVVTVGRHRLLAMLHLIDGGGDLRAIDLDGGGSTLLAPEFATTVFAERRASDPDLVPPAARVAFQFQARFPSPYDGVWITTLP